MKRVLLFMLLASPSAMAGPGMASIKSIINDACYVTSSYPTRMTSDDGTLSVKVRSQMDICYNSKKDGVDYIAGHSAEAETPRRVTGVFRFAIVKYARDCEGNLENQINTLESEVLTIRSGESKLGTIQTKDMDDSDEVIDFIPDGTLCFQFYETY